VLAGRELGEALAEAVVHGDELAVDVEVDVALVALDAGGGLVDDLAAVQVQDQLGAGLLHGLALAGLLDGELGRAARAFGGDSGRAGRGGRTAVVALAAGAGGGGQGGDHDPEGGGTQPVGPGVVLEHGGSSTR
jgi:hypothetical protein